MVIITISFAHMLGSTLNSMPAFLKVKLQKLFLYKEAM